MFVLEDLAVRKYATGEQTFGTSWMLSSDSGFESLKQVIVHEKHIKVLKKMSAYVVILGRWNSENWATNSGRS